MYNRKIPVEFIKKSAELYQQGLSSTQIAKQLGISTPTVLKFIKSQGVVPRPRQKYQSLSVKQKEELREKYINGTQMRHLAKHYKVCFSVVQKALKETKAQLKATGNGRRCRLPSKTSCLNSVYRVYLRTAKQRELDFGLTKEEVGVLIFGACFYCGRIQANAGKKTGIPYNGIDRQDNGAGYLASNVVSCCGQCNRAKSNQTVEEFLHWIAMVHEKSKQTTMSV